MDEQQFDDLVAELQGNPVLLREFIQSSLDNAINFKVLRVKRNRATVIELNGLRYVLDPKSIRHP